jgi:aspartyl protease family protein
MRSFVIFAAFMLALAGFVSRVMDQQSGSTPSGPKAATAVSEASGQGHPRTISIPRDRRGHFQVNAQVDGRSVGFMVDTGASVIALTESDAQRLGIYPVRNDFTVQVRTANGTVKAAPTTLRSVDVGGLVIRDVKALVVPDGALSENLLGLSFLTRLKRFEYADGRLVLEQ